MFFAKTFLVASLALSASAMITPHHARNVDHHAIAARVAQPEPEANPAPAPAVFVTPRKRALKRCAPHATSSLTSSAHTTPSPPPPPPVNNAAPAPPKVTPTPPPTKVAPPPPPPTKAAPPPPPPAKPAPPPSAPAKPAPSPPAPAKPAPPPSSGGGQVFSGDGTFYDTGLGACGITNNDNDMIAAIGHGAFDSFPGYNGANPNNNPICGRKVTAHYQGKSVTVAITDRCGGCDIATSLDFSPAAFKQLADPGVGRIHGVTWSYV